MNSQTFLSYYILGGALIISALIIFFSQKKPNFTQQNQSSNISKSNILKNISSSELAQYTSDPSIEILDIRTKEEYDTGHLPNSKNIDFYNPQFEQMISELDKDKKYLVYCRSGNRSGKAVDIMKRYNFSEVYNLSGGIMSVNKDLLCTTDC